MISLEVFKVSACALMCPGVAYQCYHGFLRAVQEGNIQWESRTYPYPGTPITQRFSHSQYTHTHTLLTRQLNQTYSECFTDLIIHLISKVDLIIELTVTHKAVQLHQTSHPCLSIFRLCFCFNHFPD